MPAKWISRFEIKPGRWVFEPSDESKTLGKTIKAAVEHAWHPPRFYFHLRSGGHVQAARSHLRSTHFLRADIQDFFGSVNRSRVTRCLNSRTSGGYVVAREWANASTVLHPDSKAGAKKYILPYGFVQSPILASLALDDSRLGKRLRSIAKLPNTVVSVYVDDIIVSSQDASALDSIHAAIKEDAALSGFTLNDAKSVGPAVSITAFNIELAHNSLQIESERLKKFVDAFSTTSSKQRKAGIHGYVSSVNLVQATALGD